MNWTCEDRIIKNGLSYTVKQKYIYRTERRNNGKEHVEKLELDDDAKQAIIKAKERYDENLNALELHYAMADVFNRLNEQLKRDVRHMQNTYGEMMKNILD